MDFYSWQFDGHIRCQVEKIQNRSINKIERSFALFNWKKVADGRDKKDLFLLVFQSSNGPIVSLRELTDIKKSLKCSSKNKEMETPQPKTTTLIRQKKGQRICAKCGQLGHTKKTCGRK